MTQPAIPPSTLTNTSESGISTASDVVAPIQTQDNAGRSILLTGAMSGTLIHTLPEELLVQSLGLAIASTETPIEEALKLMKVCKRWEVVLKKVPRLWTKIDAKDGLERVIKAVELSETLPIDFRYTHWTGREDFHAFVGGLGDTITAAKLRSLTTRGTGLAFKILGYAQAERLEVLSLEGAETMSPGAWGPSIVSLFNGNPATPSLKHVSLRGVSIEVAPMQLSGLRSLQLSCLTEVTGQEIIRIISESPELESLDLFWGQYTDGNLRSNEIEDQAPTQLPALRSLTIENLPPRFARALLSRFIFPNLREAFIGGAAQDPTLLLGIVSRIPHLMERLGRITAEAKEIEILPVSERYPGCSAVIAGGLVIGVRGFPRASDGYGIVGNVEKAVEWIMGHFGFVDMPVRFSMSGWLNPGLMPMLQVFTPEIGITHLSLKPYAIDPNSWYDEQLELLSQPGQPPSEAWALPDLEVFETNIFDQQGGRNVVEIIRNRNSAASAGEDGAPRKLREVHLSMLGQGRWDPSVESDPDFKREVLEAADGTAVFWNGEQWIPDETE
ncbi:hypothetical protein FRB90_000252 [Tulasnella sp. 427]|nr:hypothetical protein FRB90_000252 [Tulasnella sp. 427]